MLVNTCKSNNIYSLDRPAHRLVHQFCTCPDAREVLTAIGDKAAISVQIGDFPHHRMAFNNANNKVDIQIPENRLGTTMALSNLAFEIFNVRETPNYQKLYNQAGEGNIGMDEYAKKFEIHEFTSKEGYDALIKKCHSMFKIEPEPGVPDLETQLWNHEIFCHTDKIRERWIASFQKIYCEKHPEDQRSCKIKKEDLCDFYAYQQLPKSDQESLSTKRLCQKLPHASPKVQAFYSKEDKRYCLELLRDEL